MKLTTAVDSASRRPRRKVNAIPPSNRFPIVGIGASAGGLAAFIQLLENLPADTGMAYVFVQHLLPGHASVLPHILRRATAMPVSEATEGLRVRPNEVYVIPANAIMVLAGGRLHLSVREPTPAPALSIDRFFQSLARERQQLAIGLVFSGQATDGTQGLEAIKDGGGITFAQDKSAEYESMPSSAITAGCVDGVLAPAAMARELARIAGHAYFRRLAASQPVGGRAPARARVGKTGRDLAAILQLAQKHSGVEFARYASGATRDRIARRMMLGREKSLGGYVRRVATDGAELEALCGDLLIGGTSFFRDAAAFEVLVKKIYPELIRRCRGEALRVWTIGCAGGQETYSLAMAFVEAAKQFPRRAPALQIFGTDLNEARLNRARRGLYPKGLAQEISATRLKEFFVEEPGGYRVTKALRDRCIFGRQDVLGSAPFSQMDLVSCRNVLSALEPPAQRRVLQTLHDALRPDGFLWLGLTESVDARTDLFGAAEGRQKIFVRKTSPSPVVPMRPRLRPLPAVRPAPAPADGARPEALARRTADRIVLNQFAAPSVLLDADLNVLEFRGATGRFLAPPSGRANFQLLRMARPDLVLPLRAAIDQARRQRKPVRRDGVRVNEGAAETVNLRVVPLKQAGGRFLLVVFETPHARAGVTPAPSRELAPAGIAGDRQVRRRNIELERELREMRDYLKSLQQEHDATTEGMQASIEEAQSVNEELQSVNEELETAKEELQSGHEALLSASAETGVRGKKVSDAIAD